jgi:hypothetical protein
MSSYIELSILPDECAHGAVVRNYELFDQAGHSVSAGSGRLCDTIGEVPYHLKMLLEKRGKSLPDGTEIELCTSSSGLDPLKPEELRRIVAELEKMNGRFRYVTSGY